jgi:DNA-binding XRE family transcriptional regulator
MKSVFPKNIASTQIKVNRRDFRIALASAKISQAEFARRLHVQPQSVNSLLNGCIKSRRISFAIAAFVDCELKKLCGKKAA